MNQGDVKSSEDFIKILYEKPLGNQEVARLFELFKYKGFNREGILQALFEKVKNVNVTAELIILCAIQSPSKAANQKLTSNGLTPAQMGISASGQKGTQNLSCTRISASTADLAAFYLKKIPNLPKKLPNSDLPAWLQFPAAAAIDLPPKYRKLHREFSEEFSKRINISGKYPFNAELYEVIMSNSYLHEDLNLFDDE